GHHQALLLGGIRDVGHRLLEVHVLRYPRQVLLGVVALHGERWVGCCAPCASSASSLLVLPTSTPKTPGYFPASQSRPLLSVMLSRAKSSTVLATLARRSPYACICWIEESTIAWKTFWMRPPTNFGKSTFWTMAPNCSTPCLTAPASKSRPTCP